MKSNWANLSLFDSEFQAKVFDTVVTSNDDQSAV